MSLTPQLHPTDIEALEQLEDRSERERAYDANAIILKSDARGVRYTKGNELGARPRGWQSLDLILRSDRNAAAALPEKQLRAARVLTGFMIASSIVLVGGIASSAREGLDLSRLSGTSGILLGGGIATLAFGIATGVTFNRARRGYENAVNVYNDSLALRLGISDAEGAFRPPPGVLIDEEGFIILDQQELSIPGARVEPTPPIESAEPAEPEPPAPIVPVPIEPPAATQAAPPIEAEPTTEPETAALAPRTGLVGPARSTP
jgi:hypothetical protein